MTAWTASSLTFPEKYKIWIEGADVKSLTVDLPEAISEDDFIQQVRDTASAIYAVVCAATAENRFTPEMEMALERAREVVAK